MVRTSGENRKQTDIARALGATVPEPGEVVSLHVVPADAGGMCTVNLEGRSWRLARLDETPSEAAPKVPEPRKTKSDDLTGGTRARVS